MKKIDPPKKQSKREKKYKNKQTNTQENDKLHQISDLHLNV